MTKNSQKINLGSKVLLKINGEKEEYILVHPKEADVLKFKISTKSPVGRAILGKKAGDIVEVELKEVKLCCEILEVK